MFPMWVFIIAITAIVFGSWAVVSITRMVVSYLQGRGSDSSLTTSELAGVIGGVVEDAVRPLEEKIERLERRQLRLLEGKSEDPVQTASGHVEE